MEISVKASPDIQELINKYFPPARHPYRTFEYAILTHLTPSATVLEIGCGRTAPLLRALKGKVATLIGIDVVDFTVANEDIVLLQNDVTNMTDVATASIDVAFSRSVMEHVREVELAFAEIARALKPGGRYIFLTPNFYDYASWIAAAVPNRLHPWIVNRTEGRDEEDTFPTYFRCNTRRAIKHLAKQNGFEIEEFVYLGQYPNYFVFSPMLFRLGCIYAKFLEKTRRLHMLQGWIFCTLRKNAVVAS